MSPRGHAARYSGDGLRLTDETPVNTNMKVILAVIGFLLVLTATAVAGWINVKRDIADHSLQLTGIQLTMTADHDLGVKHTEQIDGVARTLDRIERKLDHWRIPEVVTTTTTTTAPAPPTPAAPVAVKPP